jgi:hypothetical protein
MCTKIAQAIVFIKIWDFTGKYPKESRIGDSGRLRTSVPLEGNFFLWIQ